MIEIMDDSESNEIEKVLSSFDTFFEGIDSGYKLVICRESPKHLKGFLEEIPIKGDSDISSAIDLEYLARTWGGEVLRLLLRGPSGKIERRLIIELRTYPPLKRGKPITLDGQEHDPLEVIRAVRDIFPNPPAPQQSDLMPILKVLLEKAMTPPPPAPAPVLQNGNSADQIVSLLGALSKMREFVSPQPEGAQWEAIAGEMVKAFVPVLVDKIGTQPTQKAAQRSAPISPAPIVPVVSPPLESVKTVEPTKPPMNLSEEDILSAASDQLEKMSGEQLTKLYLAALDNMPQNKRDEALNVLEGVLFVDEEDIDTEESAGTLPASISRK